MELLLVIVIIGLLMSIVVPSLAKTRLTVQRTLCSTNLRSLALATFMYMDGPGRGLLPGTDDPYFRITKMDPSVVRQPFDAIAPFLDVPVPTPESVGTIRPGAPYACPTDKILALSVGFSYMYWPSVLMEGLDEGRVEPRLVRPVTLAYERGDQYFDVLWSDLDPSTHVGIAPPELSGCNAIQFNGKVVWLRSFRRSHHDRIGQTRQ